MSDEARRVMSDQEERRALLRHIDIDPPDYVALGDAEGAKARLAVDLAKEGLLLVKRVPWMGGYTVSAKITAMGKKESARVRPGSR